MKPPPRVEDHIRNRLLDAADRYELTISTTEVGLLAHAAFGAVVQCGAARLENRPSAFGLHWREIQILERVALGLTNAEIADGLGLGEDTVKTYVAGVLRKLGAHNRAHAVLIGLAREILDPHRLIEPPRPTPDQDQDATLAPTHVEHGTLAGYEAHLAGGTPACRRCHNAYVHRLPVAALRLPRHASAVETIAHCTCREDGHLLWVGPQRTVRIDGRKQRPARASWFAHRDRVPQGYVQPECGIPSCVEPKHLADAVDRNRRTVTA